MSAVTVAIHWEHQAGRRGTTYMITYSALPGVEFGPFLYHEAVSHLRVHAHLTERNVRGALLSAMTTRPSTTEMGSA